MDKDPKVNIEVCEATLEHLINVINNQDDLKDATLSCLDVMVLINYDITLDMIGLSRVKELTEALNVFMKRVHALITDYESNGGGSDEWMNKVH